MLLKYDMEVYMYVYVHMYMHVCVHMSIYIHINLMLIILTNKCWIEKIQSKQVLQYYRRKLSCTHIVISCNRTQHAII